MRISQDLIDSIVAHSREEAPNECCGLIGGNDGAMGSVHRTTNAFASPLRYEIDSMEQYRTMQRIEEDGEKLAGIYHSHTRSEGYPSQTDINLAEGWPDPLYLICSLVDAELPVVRAFAIRDGEVEEVELDVR